MRKREEQSALVIIEQLMKGKGGFTAYKLAELLGLNVRNVRPYLKILHQRKAVFVEDWKTPKLGHGPKVPIWRWNDYGDGEDEPYPKAVPHKERAKLKRKRRNANVQLKASVGTGTTLRG